MSTLRRPSGFAVVLGNPPWERVKLQEQEFFAQRDPDVAGAPNAAARKRAIAALEDTNPDLLAEFQEATRRAEGESHLLRSSGRYPLCGRGDINTYSVFAESMRDALSAKGRMGVLAPTGIATDDTTKFFFADLVQSRTLRSLYDFENQGMFEDVHSSYKFCVLVVAGATAIDVEAKIDFSFFAHSVAEAMAPGRRFSMSPDDIALLNPNTRTCPVFRSEQDAEITKAIYRRAPVLVRAARSGDATANPWGLAFMSMFHMANDSGLFRTRDVLESEGWELSGSHFRRDGNTYLPLYEAKMTSLYDHRHGNVVGSDDLASLSGIPAVATTDEQHGDPAFCAMPRYWVSESEVRAAVEGNEWPHRYFIVFRDLARSTDARTAIHSVIPWAAVNHKTPILLPLGVEARRHAALIANLNSFVYDYTLRQKIGGASVSFFIVKQTPALPPEAYDQPCPWAGTASTAPALLDWIVPRVLELVYTSHDLESFAEALSWSGPPFVWDAERRFQIRCELDAAMFHAYGVDRSSVEHILDSFPVCRRYDLEKYGGAYRTKALILSIYDEMAEAKAHQPAQIGTHVRLPSRPRPAALAAEEVYRLVTPKRDQRYQRCVPRIDLKAAAGAFGEGQEPEFEDWVEINSATPLVRGMFVGQVVGRSMEPLIPDGAYCLFQRKMPQVKGGLIGLFQLHDAEDAESGGRFTVKRLRLESRTGKDGFERAAMLMPENPEFSPITVTEENVTFVAQFVEVLQSLESRATVSILHETQVGDESAIANGQGWKSRLDPPPGDPRAAHTAETMKRAARREVPAVVIPQADIDLDRVLVAFREVREGMSADYVVAEPAMNQRFQAAARDAGLRAEPALLNKALLNLRKAGKLKDEQRSKQHRLRKQYGPYIFTSEWSVRHLQRSLLDELNRMPALDELLCNPDWAARFDEIANRVKPGFEPIDYRWAALSIRKRGRSQPEPETLELPMHRQLTLDEWLNPGVPVGAGLYVIYADQRPVYVNWSADLSDQIARHREVAGDEMAPPWLLTGVGRANRITLASYPHRDPDQLQEMRIAHIARLEPWLNLLDLGDVA